MAIHASSSQTSSHSRQAGGKQAAPASPPASPPAAQLLGKPPFLPQTQAQLVALGHALTRPFTQATRDFWENHLALHFVGLLPNAETYFLPGESLFIATFPLPGHPDVTLEVRLSENGCRWLLENTLGKELGKEPGSHQAQQVPSRSLISTLTSLESTILEQWCHTLFEQSEGVLPFPPPDTLKPTATTLDFLWLMAQGNPAMGNSSIDDADSFGVKRYTGLSPLTEAEDYGKLVLRVPKAYLRYYLAQQHGQLALGESLAERALTHALPTVYVGLGRTRLKLEDLHALEAGDLIVLEDSHHQRINISLPQQPHTAFTAKIRIASHAARRHTLALPPQFLSQSTQEAHAMPASSPPSQNATPFWNQLHIDVHAAFEPVRIPLHDLQQLSEGLIMEVGDLTDNTIHLTVDGKSIATGELVIIGDKFGVRIQQVEADSHRGKTEKPPVIEDLKALEQPKASDNTHEAGDEDGMPVMPVATVDEEENGGGMPMVGSDDADDDDDDDDW